MAKQKKKSPGLSVRKVRRAPIVEYRALSSPSKPGPTGLREYEASTPSKKMRKKPEARKVSAKARLESKRKADSLRKEKARLDELFSTSGIVGKLDAMPARPPGPPQDSPTIVWNDTSEDGDMWDR